MRNQYIKGINMFYYLHDISSVTFKVFVSIYCTILLRNKEVITFVIIN